MVSPNTPRSVNYARMWYMVWPARKGTLADIGDVPKKGPRPAWSYRGARRNDTHHCGIANYRKRARNFKALTG